VFTVVLLCGTTGTFDGCAMFNVWFIIVVGVCSGCVVVRSGVPIAIGGRVRIDLSVCRAVFTSLPGPCTTAFVSSVSRNIPTRVVVGGTGAIRFLVSLQKNSCSLSSTALAG
jgi:hypothetical protein